MDARVVEGLDGPAKVAPWVLVWTTQGKTIRGWVKNYSLSAESDNVDVLLGDPVWIEGEDEVPMTGVDGVLIPEASIELIQVMTPVIEN